MSVLAANAAHQVQQVAQAKLATMERKAELGREVFRAFAASAGSKARAEGMRTRCCGETLRCQPLAQPVSRMSRL
jgi:hypothetical protein